MRTCLSIFRLVLPGLTVGLLVACGGGGYGGGGDSNPPATLSLSVEPTTITLGQSATLTWTTNGASCTAGGAWSGTKSAGGSENVTPTATGTLTYTLTCAGGGYGESQVAMATLTVNAAGAFTQTLLVAGFAGSAAFTTDSRLVNPRGIAVGPDAPVRVVSSGRSNEYDGNGKPRSPSRASRSGGSASTTATRFDPTGIVANNGADFIITAGRKSDPAGFLVAGKGGMIGALPRDADPADIVIMHSTANAAIYMGVTVATDGTDSRLYATDFHNNRIDVFDGTFGRLAPRAGRFSDPRLPEGYAPFGIHAIEAADGSTRIYVTYARKASSDNRGPAAGAGQGLVNVFDTRGRFLKRLVSTGGMLNAPWGVAAAPADFGSLGNALLVANSGDGRINAYDPAGGRLIGTVSDAEGRAIATPGLWGIAFGNGSNDQPRNTLFFAASTDDLDGIFGRIDPDPMLGIPDISD
jgi:uncharacterized protein (TIGR03118 family)